MPLATNMNTLFLRGRQGASSTEGSTARPSRSTRRFSETHLHQCWKFLVFKLASLLDLQDRMNNMMKWMGKQPFTAFLQEYTEDMTGVPQRAQQANSSNNQEVPFTRVIDGEVVGKMLPNLGQGAVDKANATHDPEICTHPQDQMMRRANKDLKSWICKACLTRWERKPLSEFAPRSETLTHHDLITFGKMVGKKYIAIWDDLDYANWVHMTAEQEKTSCPALKRLARYITQNQNQWTHVQMDRESFAEAQEIPEPMMTEPQDEDDL